MAAGGVAGGVLTAVDDDAVACEHEDDDGGHGDDEHAFDNISNIKITYIYMTNVSCFIQKICYLLFILFSYGKDKYMTINVLTCRVCTLNVFYCLYLRYIQHVFPFPISLVNTSSP